MSQDYQEFLKSKRLVVEPSGFDCNHINESLFPFQRDIVKWALKKGKSAIFSNTGTGKTRMQLAWADCVCNHTNGNVLILAPLAVNRQTVEEGSKMGIEVNLCRTQADVKPGINITNYEMLDHFDPDKFAGVVLDESGILKSFEGKIRNQIITAFNQTPFRLACTATPAPNDHMELGNHAEFLQVMNRVEMLATFFVHDGGDTSKWRLKGHAVDKFWQWVASWAVMLSTPSDLGYDDDGFILPPLNIEEIVVDRTGYIVREAQTLQDRRAARTDSLDLRVAAAKKLIMHIKGSRIY